MSYQILSRQIIANERFIDELKKERQPGFAGKVAELLEENRQLERNRATSHWEFNIYALRVRDDDGDNLADIIDNQILEWVNRANTIFSTVHPRMVEFHYDPQPNVTSRIIDSTAINQNDDDTRINEVGTTEAHRIDRVDPDGIPVFFRQSGGASFYSHVEGHLGFIVMSRFNAPDVPSEPPSPRPLANLLAHELGHYFGLCHTHAFHYYWDRWEEVPISAGGIAAVSPRPGRIDIFGIGENNDLLHRVWDCGSGGAWQSKGGIISGPIAAVQGVRSDVHIFVRGQRGLWHTAVSENPVIGDVWQPWSQVFTDFTGIMPTAAVVSNGDILVFGKTGHGHQDQVSLAIFSNGAWSSEQRTLMECDGDPVCVLSVSDTVNLFGQQGDELNVMTFEGANLITGATVGNGVAPGSVIAAAFDGTFVHVFTLNNDNALQHKWGIGDNWATSSNWRNRRGRWLPNGRIVAASARDGNIHVVGMAVDGSNYRIAHTWGTRTGSWPHEPSWVTGLDKCQLNLIPTITCSTPGRIDLIAWGGQSGQPKNIGHNWFQNKRWADPDIFLNKHGQNLLAMDGDNFPNEDPCTLTPGFPNVISRITDTPPDPMVKEVLGNTSVTQVTVNGITFMLPRDNLMSYYDNGPGAKAISRQQGTRIHEVAEARLARQLR